jgi:hypothetical protein
MPSTLCLQTWKKQKISSTRSWTRFCSATAPSTFLIALRRCALICALMRALICALTCALICALTCALICALICALEPLLFCTCASIFLFCCGDRTQQMLGLRLRLSRIITSLARIPPFFLALGRCWGSRPWLFRTITSLARTRSGTAFENTFSGILNFFVLYFCVFLHLTGANLKRHHFRERLLWYLEFFHMFFRPPVQRTPSLKS